MWAPPPLRSGQTAASSLVLFCIAPLAFILFVLSQNPVHGAFLASTKLENCVKGTDGLDVDSGLQCSRKIVTAITIDNAQNGTEALQLVFSNVTDEKGSTLYFSKPWELRMRKSRIVQRYPLSYEQTFNAAPRELVLTSSYLTSSCVDGANAGSPTCGWFRDEAGNNVPDSQGFCCSCSLASVIGFSGDDQSRAKLNCNLFGSAGRSAHCLRFGELWYNAYNIGPTETAFWIDVDLLRYLDKEAKYEVEKLRVGPQVTGVRSKDNQVLVKLLGDFSPYTSPPVLSSKYLFVPSSPSDHERIRLGASAWMLLDRSLVTLDGRECNKIGVSFSAFRHEFGQCTRSAGSCINNQLEDFYEEDLEKKEAGVAGRYLAEFFGDFFLIRDDTVPDKAFLAYEVRGMQQSVLTITSSADDIRFVTNKSPGEINLAEVETFEGFTRNGKMRVLVTNTGFIIADYWVTVTDCNPEIKEIQAQSASIQRKASNLFIFDVYAENGLQQDHQCTVTLFDSEHYFLESRIVYFNTTSTVLDLGGQSFELSPDDTGFNERVDFASADSDACSCSFLNIICVTFGGCWLKMFGSFLFYGSIIALLILAKKFGFVRVFCWPCRAIKNIRRQRGNDDEDSEGSSSSSSSSSSSDRRRRRRRRKVQKERNQIKQQKRRQRMHQMESKRVSEAPRWEEEDEEDLYPSLPPQKKLLANKPLARKDVLEAIACEYPVYFNLINPNSELGDMEGLQSPGPEFSLMGRLVEDFDEEGGASSSSAPPPLMTSPVGDVFWFVLDPDHVRQRIWYNVREQQYQPTRGEGPLMKANLFTVPMNLKQIRRRVSLAPKHPCLNQPRDTTKSVPTQSPSLRSLLHEETD